MKTQRNSFHLLIRLAYFAMGVLASRSDFGESHG